MPTLFTSCHSCGTTRLLQHFADFLDRFIEEERIRGKGTEMENTWKGKADMVPPLFIPKRRLRVHGRELEPGHRSSGHRLRTGWVGSNLLCVQSAVSETQFLVEQDTNSFYSS